MALNAISFLVIPRLIRFRGYSDQPGVRQDCPSVDKSLRSITLIPFEIF